MVRFPAQTVQPGYGLTVPAAGGFILPIYPYQSITPTPAPTRSLSRRTQKPYDGKLQLLPSFLVWPSQKKKKKSAGGQVGRRTKWLGIAPWLEMEAIVSFSYGGMQRANRILARIHGFVSFAQSMLTQNK